MPRFFLDVMHQGARATRDYCGRDLPDLDAAEAAALELWTRIVAREVDGDGSDILTWKVHVRDAAGRLLAEVPSDLCPFRPCPDPLVPVRRSLRL